MSKYRFEVEVCGWITREVEAPDKDTAVDMALDIDLSIPLGDLQWKTTTIEENGDD
jgi:hypothetical protein